MRRIAGWAFLAFALYWLLTSPDSAAGLVTHVLDGLRAAASSLASFADKL